MKPPIPYFGAKVSAAQRIVSLLPPHTHYVEPFAGSLAVLLAKPLSKIETVNDLDGALVEFWRVLRDRPDELIRVCELTPHSRAEHQAAYEPSDDEVERARRVWVRLTQGQRNVLGRTGWWHAQGAGPGHSPRQRLATFAGRLAPAAERLKNVSIECRPAVEIIASYGKHRDVCLYVDPPYVGDTRQGRGYREEMHAHDEHVELAQVLHACEANVLLSGYRSDLYDELFADWPCIDFAATTGQGKVGNSARVETLWSNRPFDSQLAF